MKVLTREELVAEAFRIEKARQRKTYTELEALTEINGKTLQKKLNGRSPINIQQFLSLCSALDVSAPALIARTEARLTEENIEGVV